VTDMAKTTPLSRAADLLRRRESFLLSAVPDGFDAMAVADLVRAAARDGAERPEIGRAHV